MFEILVTDWLAFAVLCLSWGSTFVALKIGLEGFAPINLAAWRFVLAGAILWIIARAQKLPSLPFRAFKPILIATLALVVNYALLFVAAPFLPSGLAATFSFATVAFSLTISGIIFKLEPPRITTWLGLMLGLIGLVLLALPRLSAQTFWPVLAVIIGNVFYVLSGLLLRETLREHGTISVTTAQMLGGGMILFALSLMFESGQIPTPTPRAVAGLMYLFMVGSVIGFSLYQFLLVRWPPARLALYNFICPVIALGLGAILIQERLSLIELLATGLMLAGAALSGLARGR